MSNLGSQQINATYGYLLQIPGGLTSSLVTVQDGSGNNLPLSISTTGATGTFTGGTINGMVIGGVNPAAGTFTTIGGTTITASTQFTGPGTGLTGTASSLSVGGSAGSVSGAVAATTLSASGVVTINTTTNNQSYTTTGAGAITITSGTAGNINNMNIGATTAGTGAFTTLSASSTVSGTGFSTYLASPPAIGTTTPSTGSFTTLGATGAITANTTTNNQSYTTTGAGTITLTSGTTGSINNFNIGASTAGTGAFTTLSASSTFTLSGGTANGVLYLNGSKAVTSGTALVFDGTNFSATGSATATALIPSGSTVPTNGIFLPAANTVAWSTNTTERMRIDSSGNVGIGTSSPATKLQVSGGSVTELRITSSGDITTGSAALVRFGGSNSQTSGYIGYGGTASGYDVWNALAGSVAFGTSNLERMRIDSSGNVGIGTTAPAVKLAVSSTDAILVPVGTTAQRPTAAAGLFRLNTTLSRFEGYNGSAWGSLGGATGGGTDAVFYLNGQTVNTTYAIPSGQNAHSVGPISIASGQTVTVPSGSRWVIS